MMRVEYAEAVTSKLKIALADASRQSATDCRGPAVGYPKTGGGGDQTVAGAADTFGSSRAKTPGEE